MSCGCIEGTTDSHTTITHEDYPQMHEQEPLEAQLYGPTDKDKDSELVTWADLEKMRDELIAQVVELQKKDLDKVRDELIEKFVELQQKVLPSDADPMKPSTEVEDLGNEEKDEEESGVKQDLRDKLKEKHKELQCYEFEESTWDSTIFAFIYPLRRLDSLWTLFLGILNIALQIALCSLIQAHFTTIDDPVEPARKWRTMNGHWQKYANNVGTSLTARVCKQDVSIELSGSQLGMYQLADGYIASALPWQNDSFAYASTAVGPLLCFICLSLWYLTSLWCELHRCWCLLKALSDLPRALHSSLQIIDGGFAIKQISMMRLIVIIMMTFTRLGIACLLFYSGCVWLAATAELGDLILNAAALAFVLEIDNMICACLLPRPVLAVLRNVSPIGITYQQLSLPSVSPRSSLLPHGLRNMCTHVPWHSLICGISMLTATILTYNVHVVPQFNRMSTSVDAICGEPRDFVVDTHGPTGIVFSYSQLQEEGAEPVQSLMEQVVEDMIQLGSSKDSLPSSSWSSFRTDVALPLEDFIGSYGDCHDFHDDKQYLRAPLQRALGNYSLQSCEDLSEKDCMAPDPIVRFACPETCGCTSPYGFFMLEGCPLADCQTLNPDKWPPVRAALDVEVRILQASPVWQSYWLSYVHVMEATNKANDTFADMSAYAIRDRFTEYGCQAIERIGSDINDARRYFCTASSKRRSLQL